MKIINELKRIFIKVDTFREELEDVEAKIFLDMSKFTSLDELKSAIIIAVMTTALNSCSSGVVGTLAVTLTGKQLKTAADVIIKLGHRAEKEWADQLRKKDKFYKSKLDYQA